MHVIDAANVNDALREGLKWLAANGTLEQSRNGAVLVAPCPVVTVYKHPEERVLFSALRDANPFFHLMEAMWMLAGRNDVEFPAYYAANIATFSDDTRTLHGAYGFRWREVFGYDQLPMIIDELHKNRASRRCVLSMWDATQTGLIIGHEGAQDLHKSMNGGKDVPCNTHAYFDTLGGKLNMTVCNRSNDVIWGCYGANAVHFSILLEYVSCCTGIPMGVYRQFSNNYHVYADRPDVQKLLQAVHNTPLLSSPGGVYGESRPLPLIEFEQAQEWHEDMEFFFSDWVPGQINDRQDYKTQFWADVVIPVVNAHAHYKKGDFSEALYALNDCVAQDWGLACTLWLKRRQEKRNV